MNSSVPPAAQEYAGDEINALVLDPGSHTTRAGFAGEDTPKSVVPTHYGITAAGEKVYGENAIHVPEKGLDVRNPYGADGIVEDWDTASKLWEFAITSRLTGSRQTAPSRNGLNDLTEEEKARVSKDENGDVVMEGLEQLEQEDRPMQENPLLMTEPGWNPVKAREKTTEIAMEEWGVPAFFLAKNGQLASYASGKATALVVDIGAQNTSVTPLWEGMVLRKGIHKSPLAGNWVSQQIRLMFAAQQPPVPLVPHYMVASKTPVDAGAPSSATYVKFAKPPSDSFRQLEEERVLTSFKESVVQAWQGPGKIRDVVAPSGFKNEDHIRSLPQKPFELPDGWNQVFGLDRFKVVEGLYDPSAAYTDTSNPQPNPTHSLTSLVNAALNQVDIDTRAVLLNNIILTGAGSLIEKLADRLQSELQVMYPNPKVRVIASNNSVERKYGAWIGGSVLGSLGTFHQMWVSKKEYDEHGPNIVEKRCK